MRIQKSHFTSKMKIGSKFYIHLSYSKVHFISKFLFFSCTATMAGHHASWSSAEEDPCLTELLLCKEHTDTTPITEAVMGDEDSVIFQVKKPRDLRISREHNFYLLFSLRLWSCHRGFAFSLAKGRHALAKHMGKWLALICTWYCLPSAAYLTEMFVMYFRYASARQAWDYLSFSLLSLSRYI